MSNAVIYICTHKDFEPKVSADTYQILNSKDIQPYKGLDDKFWSEFLHIFHVYYNTKPPKYIGFCHYRRYFSFLDNIPNFDEIFKNNDIIAANPIKFQVSCRQQYAHCHNIKDLEIIEDIIRTKYPGYVEGMENFLNGQYFFSCNLVIMKRKDFRKWVEFVDGVMTEFLNRIGTDINKRIEENKEDYLKGGYPNNTVDYQYRLGGYITERLTNIFLFSSFEKIYTYDLILTENKY